VTPEQILAHPPRVLSEAQCRAYLDTGFLAAAGLIPEEWLRRLVELSNAFLEESRSVARSNEAFDLGPEHGPDRPHVRRLRAMVDRHPDFWGFASESVLADIAADLVGPDVKFHSSKLNYKMAGCGRDRQMAPGHPGLAAYQLQPGDPGCVSRRCAGRAGAADLSPG
jgi:hypothetical protein